MLGRNHFHNNVTTVAVNKFDVISAPFSVVDAEWALNVNVNICQYVWFEAANFRIVLSTAFSEYARFTF